MEKIIRYKNLKNEKIENKGERNRTIDQRSSESKEVNK